MYGWVQPSRHGSSVLTSMPIKPGWHLRPGVFEACVAPLAGRRIGNGTLPVRHLPGPAVNCARCRRHNCGIVAVNRRLRTVPQRAAICNSFPRTRSDGLRCCDLPLRVFSLPASCPSLSLAPQWLKEIRPSSTICLQTPLLFRQLPAACLSRKSLPRACGLDLALRWDRFA